MSISNNSELLNEKRHKNEFESDFKAYNLIVFHVFFPGQTKKKKKMFPVCLNKAKLTKHTARNKNSCQSEKLSVCDLFCEFCDI